LFKLCTLAFQPTPQALRNLVQIGGGAANSTIMYQ
jgi:hypothetical protein